MEEVKGPQVGACYKNDERLLFSSSFVLSFIFIQERKKYIIT